MEFEFWWLIGFPVFFGLGWLAARIDLKHLISESRALPRSYFKGLNFLLNEQPDQSLEQIFSPGQATAYFYPPTMAIFGPLSAMECPVIL